MFVAFPYVAIVLAIWGGVHRYRHDRFSYSTLSSQLLENRNLFWGSVPWHYGIVVVLFAHLIGFLVPGMWASLTVYAGSPVYGRVDGLYVRVCRTDWAVRTDSCAASRRSASCAVTSPMDWVLLVALLRAGGAWLLGFAGLPLGRRLVYRHGRAVAYLAGEPKSPDPLCLVFALGGPAAHAQRLRGDRPVPVLAAGASDHVPVLVPVAALSAPDQKPRHQIVIRKP